MEEVVKRLEISLQPRMIREAMDVVKTLDREVPLLEVLVDEVTTMHQSLQHISSSLTHLLNYLHGDEELTASHSELLQLLSSNKTPREWAKLIGLASGREDTPSLATALKLVHSRVHFLTRSLTASDCKLPSPLQVTCFSLPAAVPSALVQAYALQHQLSVEEVSIRGTVSMYDRGINQCICPLSIPPSLPTASLWFNIG